MTEHRSRLFSEFASSDELQAGVIRWPDDARLTVIVKATFELGDGGRGLQVIPGDPPYLDIVDRDGELLYPSDFAPYKPRCDWVVVGDDAKDKRGTARWSCAGTAHEAREGARLGGRELFARAGDPTEPSALKVWASGQIDFVRFQCAPPDQRIDPPRLPFALAYGRNDVAFEIELPGPEPEAVVLDESGWSAPERVALVLDTICVAPSAARVVLVWRGVSQLSEHLPEAPLLAVGFGSLRRHATRTILAWQRRALVQPADLRGSTRTSGADAAAGAAAAELEDETDRELERPETESDPGPPDASFTVSFSDRTSSAMGASAAAASPLPFREARPGMPPARYPSDASEEVDFAGETMMVTAPSAGAALPFRDRHLPSSSEREDATPKRVAAPSVALPFALAPAVAKPMVRPPARAEHPRALARADIAPASPWQAHTAWAGAGPSVSPIVRPPVAASPTANAEKQPAPRDGSWGVPSYMAAGAALAPQVGFARPEDEIAVMQYAPAPIAPPVSNIPSSLPQERAVEETPVARKDLSLEECAALDASIARRPENKEKLIEANGLDELRWREIEHHWSEEILHTAGRGEMELLDRYDEAYVARVEEERGPLEPAEYARIVVAAERGGSAEVMSELTIPKEALFRLERIWLKRMASDPAFAKIVQAALKSARAPSPPS